LKTADDLQIQKTCWPVRSDYKYKMALSFKSTLLVAAPILASAMHVTQIQDSLLILPNNYLDLNNENSASFLSNSEAVLQQKFDLHLVSITELL